jgi:putative ABC transport system permease protein
MSIEGASEQRVPGGAGREPAIGADVRSRPAERSHRRGMSIGEAVRVALQGLASNKLRSLLTMLGIIIGVGSVIAMMAIGQGASEAARATMTSMGTNVMQLMAGQQSKGGVSFGFGSTVSLKPEDAVAIKKECPGVLDVTQEYNGNVRVKYQNQNSSTSIQGTTPNYMTMRNFQIDQGRYFTTAEVRRKAKVVVLGSAMKDTLFGNLDPIGKKLRVNGQSFTVIGIFRSKGGSGWRNPDDAIYAPVTTVMRRVFGKDYISGMSIQVASEDKMNDVQDEVDALMRKRHKIQPSDPSDVRIFNQADLLQTAQQQTGIFTMLLAGVAGVSLFVGGIGIMNIMLVTVTERTREIGIRKAIGAKRSDIRNQFLIEAVTMSLVGGLLGIALGLAVTVFGASSTGWNMVVTPQSILLSFGFSAIVGILFGVYPAGKASRLNPIDALRYE